MKKSSLYLACLSLLLDLFAVFIGMLLAYYFRANGATLYYWPYINYFRLSLLTLPIWLIVLSSVGLYNPRTLPRGWNSVGRLLIAVLAGWGILLITLYLYRTPATQALPRLLILYGIIDTIIGLFISKLAFTELVNWLYIKNIGTIRTVVIGEKNDFFSSNLLKNKANGRAVVKQFGEEWDIDALDDLYRQHRFDELIIFHQSTGEKKMVELLNWADNHNVSFVVIPSAVSIRSSNVEVGTLAGNPAMFFMRSPLDGWGRIYKRIFDFCLSLIALIILSPFFLIIIILEKVISPGPVFFRQERVGQDGKIFFVHKFRSMYVDADARFKQYAGWSTDESKDPRITPLGRFLRRSNIDELPQLWDIFNGTMSIVGPRPEQPKYVEKFSHEIPDYLKRHHVKTGLTGWAQVNGLRGDTSIPDRVKYDLFYIQNWSILFDIRVMVSTGLLVFRQLLGKKQ